MIYITLKQFSSEFSKKRGNLPFIKNELFFLDLAIS
jgi:hypothetical protein